MKNDRLWSLLYSEGQPRKSPRHPNVPLAVTLSKTAFRPYILFKRFF